MKINFTRVGKIQKTRNFRRQDGSKNQVLWNQLFSQSKQSKSNQYSYNILKQKDL